MNVGLELAVKKRLLIKEIKENKDLENRLAEKLLKGVMADNNYQE